MILDEYRGKTFDEERALYGARDIKLTDCAFDGAADGESALKESSGVIARNCDFRLRYPLWHASRALLEGCRMTETCRAALWYAEDIKINGCRMEGIKAVRECGGILIEDSTIDSPEFGWMSRDLTLRHTRLVSEYPFLQSRRLELHNVELEGKYSFQYVEDMEIRNSSLKTKDAFWHSRNVTVYDSVIEGEYLGWYSENLRLVRCTIRGTQPFCYARGLVLEECEMIRCDLAFEKSDVKAELIGSLDSIKNPLSGYLRAQGVGDIILDGENPGNEFIVEIKGERQDLYENAPLPLHL